jgi:hypothetical protein
MTKKELFWCILKYSSTKAIGVSHIKTVYTPDLNAFAVAAVRVARVAHSNTIIHLYLILCIIPYILVCIPETKLSSLYCEKEFAIYSLIRISPNRKFGKRVYKK